MTEAPRATALPWWKTATGYQIYPRSFCDSNGDGIGDIPGITSKLDYLQELGIGFIWLSPVYASPMADNGYDISDYHDISPEFGTLEDFDRLVTEARARDIRIVMDLVVNHTSDQHHWFKTACQNPQAPEHDFYIWREPSADGGPPSALRAMFGGPAWHWVERIGKYYLGYFSPEQPDLNWENPALRSEIFKMMRWWVARGIGGFRMDVISLIGKDVDAEVFEEGPYLFSFLAEMHAEVLAGTDLVTVGESWSVTPETALDYCGSEDGALSMVFQFDHVKQGWDPDRGKFHPLPFDLPRFKAVFNTWQAALADDGWNSLFLTNHDLPRQVSVYGDDQQHRVACAKMLATVLHLMKGTPFVYQGEEIGMTNARFERISQFRDVETLRLYAEHAEAGQDEAAFLAGANANGRDNARTPMQWSDGPNAGFTSGNPWIDVNANHTFVNVAADQRDPNGVYQHYRRLIALRRSRPVISSGRYSPALEDHPSVFAYLREDEEDRVAVIANFSGEAVTVVLPPELAISGESLIATHSSRGAVAGTIALSPYEAFAILRSRPFNSGSEIA